MILVQKDSCHPLNQSDAKFMTFSFAPIGRFGFCGFGSMILNELNLAFTKSLNGVSRLTKMGENVNGNQNAKKDYFF